MLYIQMIEELKQQLDSVSRELGEGREEGERLRVEIQGREEKVREVEGESRAMREQLEEKDRLLKIKEKVRMKLH